MNTTASAAPGFWRSVPLFAVGALFGLLGLIALRVEYYQLMQYRSNMAPGIAFFFLPILLPILLLVALPLEALLRRLFFKPTSLGQLLLVGSSHALLLSWWAFPDHWWIVAVLNPIVARWLLGLRRA